jgi:hypothetical protein
VFDSSTAPQDPVDGILDLLEQLASEKRAGWAAAGQSERVAGLARVVERAEAALIGATATWDGAVAYAEDGALSPIGWLLHHTPMSKARAERLVRCARLVRRNERTAKTLAARCRPPGVRRCAGTPSEPRRSRVRECRLLDRRRIRARSAVAAAR